MPVDANDLTRMRSRPQAADFYLAVMHPVTVWSGLVNGSPDRGAISIPFDNATELTAPEEHFTLWVGGPGITGEGEDDVGVLRFKSKTANTMSVGSNDIAWVDTQNLTIKREVRPWAVLPNLENTKEDSNKTYVDENTVLHPLGRIGPPGCAILENGTTTVNFWSASVSISEDGLKSHAWVFDDGSPASSAIAGTEGVPIEVTYTTPGQKWVKYTVEDNNGKTHVRYSMVYVFNTTTDIAISGFNVDSLVGDFESGVWRASITVTQDCDVTEFPEMAQVVIFNKAYWNGAQADVGYGWTHRENISFVGYIVKDSVRKNAETGNTTFEVTSTVSIMKNLTCWGASLKSTGTAGWHTIPSMTLNLAAFHVFTEHTTLDHIADIYLDLDNIAMAYIDVAEGSPYDHIKTAIGEAGRAILANNKFGQIYLEPNSQVSKEANRPVDVMFTMDHGDWRDEITLGEERDIENTCQVDFIGFIYSGTDPVPYGSLAPGRQWSTGNVQKVTGVRVDDGTPQADANIFSGLFAGNLNNEFDNVVVPMAGFWPVFDIVPQRYVRITLVASDTNRGLEWNSIRHLPAQVVFNINNEGGYVLTDITFRQYAYGVPGIDNPIPTAPPTPPDPPPPPAPPDPPAEPWEGPVKACVAWTHDQLGYTSDLLLHHYAAPATAGTTGTDLYDTEADFITLGVAVGDTVEEMGTAPTPANITTVASVVDANHLTLAADIGLAETSEYHICGTQWVDIIGTISGTILHFIYVRTGESTVGGWVLTTSGVYYTANILTPSPTWSLKLTIAQVRAATGDTSATGAQFGGIHGYMAEPEYVIISIKHGQQGAVPWGFPDWFAYSGAYVHTHDLGVDGWAYANMPAAGGGAGDGNRYTGYSLLEVCEETGKIWGMRSWGGTKSHIHYSLDLGGSFARYAEDQGTLDYNHFQEIYNPFSAGASIIYMDRGRFSSYHRKSSDGGATLSEMAALDFTVGEAGKQGVDGWVYNANDIIMTWKSDADGLYYVLRSSDAGSIWVVIADIIALFGGEIAPGVFGALAKISDTWLPDEDVVLLVGLQVGTVANTQICRIRYTQNNGGDWYNKMGNWLTVFGSWDGGSPVSPLDQYKANVGCTPLPRVGANI